MKEEKKRVRQAYHERKKEWGRVREGEGEGMKKEGKDVLASKVVVKKVEGKKAAEKSVQKREVKANHIDIKREKEKEGKKGRSRERMEEEEEEEEVEDEDTKMIRYYGRLLGKRKKSDALDGLDDILQILTDSVTGDPYDIHNGKHSESDTNDEKEERNDSDEIDEGERFAEMEEGESEDEIGQGSDESDDEDSRMIRYYSRLLGKRKPSDKLDGLDEILEGISSGKVRGDDYASASTDSNDDNSDGRDEEDVDLMENTQDRKVKSTPKESLYLSPPSSPDKRPLSAPSPLPSPSPALSLPLDKTLRGLLNRLSEANSAGISQQIIALYGNYPRGDVTDHLIRLLESHCEQNGISFRPLSVAYAGLIIQIVRSIGLDAGGKIVEAFAKKIDANYHKRQSDSIDICSNYLLLFCHLLGLRLLHSSLFFELLEIYSASLRRIDVELILLLIKNAGHFLRSDDPASLKAMILRLQENIRTLYPGFVYDSNSSSSVTPNPIEPNQADANEDENTVMVSHTRLRFMLDVIYDLKNNKRKLVPKADLNSKLSSLRQVSFQCHNDTHGHTHTYTFTYTRTHMRSHMHMYMYCQSIDIRMAVQWPSRPIYKSASIGSSWWRGPAGDGGSLDQRSQ